MNASADWVWRGLRDDLGLVAEAPQTLLIGEFRAEAHVIATDAHPQLHTSQMPDSSPRPDSTPQNRPQRLPMAVCAAVAELLSGSHSTLEDMFYRAGAVGDPPGLAHHFKWKAWLYELGQNPEVDGLKLVGQLIEEFMDLPPLPRPAGDFAYLLGPLPDPVQQYKATRDRLERVLDEHGLRYFRGGRVLPTGAAEELATSLAVAVPRDMPRKPDSVEALIGQIIRGLPRAMHPLAHRRRDAVPLTFDSEYDIQDLLHSHLRSWISDIRPEEYTPSYAGTSTRMDFLLPAYDLVLEVKRVRSREHSRRIGDELIVDIEHYRAHPRCKRLWCVIYDPQHYLQNPEGLASDLRGLRSGSDGASVAVEVVVFGAAI